MESNACLWMPPSICFRSEKKEKPTWFYGKDGQAAVYFVAPKKHYGELFILINIELYSVFIDKENMTKLHDTKQILKMNMIICIRSGLTYFMPVIAWVTRLTLY